MSQQRTQHLKKTTVPMRDYITNALINATRKRINAPMSVVIPHGVVCSVRVFAPLTNLPAMDDVVLEHTAQGTCQ